ncbi:hypothetical protein QBC37DRAFT_417695 [Rhypophila decipiens]|uniref:Uncharacterized protein n=1 Tax=Rhypophila decipiens TaxID=261697 RepID=A0AAN6YDZ4_9PEZI|nr:hypothetical protein QBC37DRAFT_417695 [Rhypophila decipiens]
MANVSTDPHRTILLHLLMSSSVSCASSLLCTSIILSVMAYISNDRSNLLVWCWSSSSATAASRGSVLRSRATTSARLLSSSCLALDSG